MVMPQSLFLVRHGESEGNVANRASRKGDNSYFANEQFRNRHSSQWRLTDKGIEQACWAGKMIRSLDLKIGRMYTSPYFRAMETLACMDLDGPRAMSAYELRERSWGKLDRLTHEERMQMYASDIEAREEDPFLWGPPEGEPLVTAIGRIRDWQSTLWRECGDMECVVACCHAEVMEVNRVVIERMLPHQYTAMMKDPTQGIWNCSILQYTRRDPVGGGVSLAEYFKWVRLITPPDAHQHGEIGFGWREIIRPTFTNAELLAQGSLVVNINLHLN